MQKKMKRKTTSRTAIPKRKPRSKDVRHRITRDPQDEKLCLTKGQLLNVVIASEFIGYNNAKKKRKPQKCCPKAKRFVKELKADI